jgi:hypothetical protein
MTARHNLYDHRADAVCGPGVHLTISLCDECAEEQAEEVARFVEKVMVVGMDEVLNPGLGAAHSKRVPVEADVEVVDSWGEG